MRADEHLPILVSLGVMEPLPCRYPRTSAMNYIGYRGNPSYILSYNSACAHIIKVINKMNVGWQKGKKKEQMSHIIELSHQ